MHGVAMFQPPLAILVPLGEPIAPLIRDTIAFGIDAGGGNNRLFRAFDTVADKFQPPRPAARIRRR